MVTFILPNENEGQSAFFPPESPAQNRCSAAKEPLCDVEVDSVKFLLKRLARSQLC